MDIEKLIDRLRENTDCWTDKVHGYADLRLEAATALSTLQAENEKLRAELEQIPSCIYYKQGGLCRYGGDDPANVCVLGPCDHDVSVQDVLTELERVKEERDAAVDCIYQIEDDLDRGSDNDWAREHIAEWESQKEDGHGTALQNDTLCV